MPSISRASIAERLNAAQIAINNAIADPEIAAAVAEFGYTPEKIGEGKQFLDAAVAALNAQKVAAGAQRISTVALKKAEKKARDAYQALAKVARACLNKAQLTSLGLNRAEPKPIAAFLTAAYALFDNARTVPEVSEILAEHRYNETKLNAGRELIVAFDTANQQQEVTKGNAQQATQDQNEAMKTLHEWYAKFIKIAKVALRDQKQMLEKLGVTSRTSKTAAQRAGAQKAAETKAAKKNK